MELAVLAILASQFDPKIPCLCWDYRKVYVDSGDRPPQLWASYLWDKHFYPPPLSPILNLGDST